jgi:CheY-like chemotaxis protein
VERLQLLIAEDDQAIAEMYRLQFEHHGWNVRVACDGERALEMVASQVPALILMDIQMPRMSGLEVLRALRSESSTADVPVVVISNCDDPGAIQNAHHLKILGWLVKSKVTPEQLVTFVRSSARSRQ